MWRMGESRVQEATLAVSGQHFSNKIQTHKNVSSNTHINDGK